MKRFIILAVVAIAAAGVFADAADAQRKRKQPKAKAIKIPVSEAIAPALGKLKWGMSEDEVLKLMVGQVQEKYRPQIAKTTDGIEEDRLRTLAKNEIQAIRDSLARFDGQASGWDLGFLKEEFSHNNGEAMIVVKDSNSQNFYFFIQGRLWKWYKAFNIEVFEGKSFGEFAAAVQRKFGEAQEREEELVPGAGKRHWLEWQDDSSRLRAIDQTSFYGFYCLVFEEKKTVESLASLRANAPKAGPKSHALVDAVTSDTDIAAEPDKSPDIVDRITGKIRVREDAPEKPAGKGSTKRPSPPSDSEPSDDEF